MAGNETSKTTVFPLPFEVPDGFGEPIQWLAIAINERGETYLRAPLGTHPELSLVLVAEAMNLISQAVARCLREALLRERIMAGTEDAPALAQGTA